MGEISISCTITMVVGKEDGIVELEKKAAEQARQGGCELLRQAMARRESQKRQELGACLHCGSQAWESRGRVVRKVVTLAGAVAYGRQKVVCRECGHIRYPMDEALGLEEQRNSTLGVMEQSLWLAVEMPYDRASDALKRIGLGVAVSGRQIQSWAKEEGKRLKAKLENEKRSLFEQGIPLPEPEREIPDRVFVGVDGTFVNRRDGGGEIETKVGVIYSGREKIGKNRWELLDKRTYATTDRIDGFREQFILECHRWGVWEAKAIVFVGDGAPWIKRLCQEHFPGAIYVLDYWHLAENMRRAFGKERESLVEGLLPMAKDGRGKEFHEGLRRIYCRSRDPDFRKKLGEFLEYVSNNLEGIENYQKLDSVGSSGAIEKAVDVSVCRRFKRRGMSWLSPGLSSLLALKLLKLNGEWEGYWRARGLPV